MMAQKVTGQITVQEVEAPGLFLVDRDSLIAFLEARGLKKIHNFRANSHIIIGADHDVQSVIEDIKRAERVAVIVGSKSVRNLGHALALILNGETELYDIGDLTEEDLLVEK